MHIHTAFLPDEHVFSTLARELLLAPSPSTMVEKQRSALKSVFALSPFHIFDDNYVMAFNKLAGLQFSIVDIFRFSLLGFYEHFLGEEHRSSLLSDILARRSIKAKIPLLSKLQSMQQWRHCPSCVEDDEKQFGVAYWHVGHQLPTTNMCHKHSEQTLISGCCRCGWKNTDLRKHPLPSNTCPECEHELVAFDNQQTNAANQSIQQLGLDLYYESPLPLQSKPRRQMLRSVEHAFGDTIRTRNQEYWKTKTQVENEFRLWTLDNQIASYFDIKSEAELNTMLCLDSIINSPSKVTPMAHIIWLAFFNQIGQPNHAGLSLVS